MNKRKLTKKILGFSLGLGFASLLGAFHSTAFAADTSDISTTSTKSQVQEIVDEGNFNYTELSADEIKHIYNLYDNDPETISQLQKQSDFVKSGNAATLSSGYIHSSQFDGYTIVKGIDVSEWNGTINWKKVKAAGIKYAFVRVGGRYTESGGYFEDDLYAENLKGAIDAGLDVGAYFFSAAINTTEAKAEAAYAMKKVAGYNLTLPIVMDYEYDSGPSGRLYNAHLSKAAATNVVKAFCSAVEKKGYVGMIYASKSVLAGDMNVGTIAKTFPVWSAQYNDEDTLTSRHSYWQYSSSGNVSGIDHATDMNFRYITNPAAVTSVAQHSSTDSTITLSWAKIPEVYAYQIVRYDESQGKYVQAGIAKGAGTTTFTDTGLLDGKKYTYKVRGYYKLNSGTVWGKYSSETIGITIPDIVENFKATVQSDSSVKLTWSTIPVSSGYRIYRADSINENYDIVATISSADTDSFIDTTALCGTKYSYKIRAYSVTDTGTIWHTISDPVSITTKPGTVTGLTVDKTTTKSISLSWNPQVNIDGYILCVWNKNDVAWDRVVKIADPYTYSYTHTGLKAGTEYSYSVVAYYKSGSSYKYTGRTSALSTYTGPAAPDNIIVSGRTEASVKLSWRKVNRASGYLIYVYDNASKNYNRVGKVSDASVLSYNVTGLKSTTTYTFAVKAYVQENGSIGYGDKKTISTCTTPVTPSNTFKYTKMGSHTYLKWSSISGASGYIVYKYNKKTNAYTKIKTLTGAASSSFVGPNLPAQYGYRIRAFIKNNGHTYVGKISDAPSKISGTLYGTVIDSWVYVRAGAGTNHSIVATLPKNRTVRIVGVRKSAKGDYWYKVSFTSGKKTKTGFMYSPYVKIK